MLPERGVEPGFKGWNFQQVLQADCRKKQAQETGTRSDLVSVVVNVERRGWSPIMTGLETATSRLS